MRPGFKFAVSLLVFGGVATGSTMYSVANFHDAKDARIAAEELGLMREELDDLEVPIYVAFLADTELDDADGDADLIAARIAAELSADKATVVVIGNVDEGVGDKGVLRDIDLPTDVTVDSTDVEVASAYVDALRSAADNQLQWIFDGDRPYVEGSSVWAETLFGSIGSDLVTALKRQGR